MIFWEIITVLYICIHICICGQCQFLNMPGTNMLLVNSSFVTRQNYSILQCAKLCWEYNLCASISFLRTTLVCKLNYLNDTMSSELLVQHDKGLYINFDEMMRVSTVFVVLEMIYINYMYMHCLKTKIHL